MRAQLQLGSFDVLSILYSIGKQKFEFQKQQRYAAFFEMSNTFSTRREYRSQPNGVHLTLFPF